jgi:hypothetical protein
MFTKAFIDSYPEGLGEQIVNQIRGFKADNYLEIILDNIRENEVVDISTKRPENDLFIEWIYFIDFDKLTFEVEGGIVNLSYNFDEIPEDWIKPLQNVEDDIEDLPSFV